MANNTASIVTALSGALTSLAATPGALSALGNHLTTSNEMQAIVVIDNMSANPATAGAMLPELTAIPGLPATVMNWVNRPSAIRPTS